MKLIGSESIVPHLNEMGEKGWFANYRAFLLSNICTSTGQLAEPILIFSNRSSSRGTILRTTSICLVLPLTRRRFILTNTRIQAFADQRWKTLFVQRTRKRIVPLIVPSETLQQVIGKLLRTRCEYLDRERYRYIGRGKCVVWQPKPKAGEGKK